MRRSLMIRSTRRLIDRVFLSSSCVSVKIDNSPRAKSLLDDPLVECTKDPDAPDPFTFPCDVSTAGAAVEFDPSKMAIAARAHFRMLMKRYDKCQAHLDCHAAKTKLLKDAGFVSERSLILSPEMSPYTRISYILSILRLFLQYDPVRFETYVASIPNFTLPLLELSAGSRFAFDADDFLRLLSFVVLLREKRPPGNHEFDCLTPALLDEAARKCRTLTRMGQLVEILEAVYRLIDRNDQYPNENSDADVTEHPVFRYFLAIFRSRSIDVLLEPDFPPADTASFCYLASLAPVDEPYGERLAERFKVRLKRYLFNLDVESTGLVCYYLNGRRVRPGSPGFRQTLDRWLAVDTNRGCSEFTKTNVAYFAAQ